MGVWKIYHKDGTILKDANGNNIDIRSLEYSDAWMGECYLTVTFRHETPIVFMMGDYIIYRNEKFVLNYEPGQDKKARFNTYGDGFVYDSVKFNSLQNELSDAEFFDVVLNDNELHYTTLPKFQFYVETLDDLLDRIQANLNEQIGAGKWKIFSRNKDRSEQRGCTAEEWNKAYGDETGNNVIDSTSITADTMTCWEALALVNSKWNINFIVRGRNVYVGTAGVTTEHMFEYGRGNGLYEIEQNADSDQKVITRLRAYGSEKNLPSHYYADLGVKYVANITKVINATTYVELDLDIDYIETYFKNPRKYIVSGETGEQSSGWVLKVTFDFKTEITGYVTQAYDSKKCRFYSELKGTQTDTGDEESKEKLDAFIAQVKAGNTKMYITSGLNKKNIPSSMKEYAENLPNNMSINRLMLPGFPHVSLSDFYDSLTDEEKKYVNPTGKQHRFSTDPHRPYIDSVNIEQIGLHSASQFFDTDDKSNGVIEIYPTIEEMVIGGVRVDEIDEGVAPDDDGRFNDNENVKNVDIYLSKAVNFDINDLKDDDFSISMKDGMCGGRTFKVASSTKVDGRWRLTIERIKDDALELWFPYKDYPIRKGDHFVLTGITLPDSYVNAASLKLLKYAIALLEKNDYTRYVYRPKVDEIFMARQHDAAMADETGAIKSLHDTLKAGDLMDFRDDDLKISGTITIDQLNIKEQDGKIPTYEITLREDKEVGTIQKIQQQITSLESGNGGSGGGGGITLAQVKGQVATEGRKFFLSKLFDDVAKGLITFEQGIKLGAGTLWKITLDGVAYLKQLNIDRDVAVKGSTKLGENGTNTVFGDYATDSTGARIQVKEDGTSIAEFDYITIRRAAQFRDITIRELRHIGGELAITPAAMVCSKVERLNSKGEVIANGDNTEPSSFKCYFETKDSDEGSEKVFNYFRPLDQARCQQFDIVADGSKKTRYYWRLVMSVGKDYIVLSNLANGGMDSLTTSEPLVGDNIVQLGYQGSDDPNRQSAIILSSTSDDAPSQKMYQGISSFSLDGCLVKDEGYDAATGVFHCNIYGDSFIGSKDGGYFTYDSKHKKATFKGTVNFESDSTLPGGLPVTDIAKKDDLKDLNIKSGNLLRNTSFCGDYESIDISEDTEISEDKETFSEKLKYWTMENASVIDTEDSTSGKAVQIGGTLSQQLAQPLLVDKAYVLSFKGKGTSVKVSIGGETHDVDMTSSFERYELHITCSDAANGVFSMVSTNCVVCEIMLSYGKLAPAWSPSYSDNDKSMAEFQNMKFLTDAITQGSTTIDGGLVMSQQFKVGNFRDKKMIRETGGMSGYYNDDDSPFLWCGGTLEQAIYTIQKYKDNPNYQPTEEEISNMAKFVVTHGGRAILNDIILRGIIYAEGGVMKSIKSPNGNFEIDEKGNAKLNGEINSTSGSIGGFEIGFNRIGFKQNFDDNGNLPNSSANQMSLYLSELIFNSKDRQAIIGCCTHYDDFLLRLIDTKRDMMPRYGGIVGVQGSADENVAMEYIGGWLSGVNFKNIICGFHHYAYSSSQPTMPTYKDYEIDRTVNCIYATTKCYWKAKDAKEESDANQLVNIKLPELKWYDDGHEILIKRGLCSDNKVNIQARRFCNLEVNYSDYGKPSYEEVWYDTILLIGRGTYVTEVELGSEMDSVCLRFFKDLSVTITNGDGTKKNYRGVWVEFKHPRDW